MIKIIHKNDDQVKGIPMIHWKHGFAVACVLMGILTALSVYWFRRLK
jgi:Mg2+ and Co2+ transporter CorA